MWAAQKMGGEGLPAAPTALHWQCWCQAERGGQPCPRDLLGSRCQGEAQGWLLPHRPSRTCRSCPGRPSRGAPREGSHCTVKTGPACCTAPMHICPPSGLPSFCTDRPSQPRPSHRRREPLSPDLPLIWPLTPWVDGAGERLGCTRAGL
uniref:Uncharacterized protein n=1 Tax=Myotis myotis TaxID=51298 RepID=A0A7J7SRI3_MYOMY|nr:hypothetical protein mMyoMyo1_009416 [Myotis myotis]